MSIKTSNETICTLTKINLDIYTSTDRRLKKNGVIKRNTSSAESERIQFGSRSISFHSLKKQTKTKNKTFSDNSVNAMLTIGAKLPIKPMSAFFVK